jgi:hypothetical protein
VSAPEPWYRHAAIVALSVLFCWPVGLALLWQHPRAPRWVKFAVTAWIVLSILFTFGAVISAVVD